MLSHPLLSYQAVNSLINTREARCQGGKSTLGTSAWDFPKSKRPRERGCHLRGFHYVGTFQSGVQTVDRKLRPGNFFLPQLDASHLEGGEAEAGVALEASGGRAKGALRMPRVGFLPACTLSLPCLCPPLPLPCFLSAGPHPRPLPARLEQQPLIHDILHALLASTPPPSQCHAAFSPAPFAAVHEAEELQPARYLCTRRVVGAGFVGGGWI